MFSNPAIPILLLGAAAAIIALLKRHGSRPDEVDYEFGAGHQPDRADGSAWASNYAHTHSKAPPGEYTLSDDPPANFRTRGPVPFDRERDLHAPYGRPRL